MASEIHEKLTNQTQPADLLISAICEVTFKQFSASLHVFVRQRNCSKYPVNLVKACAHMKGQCRNLEPKEDRILINCSRAISINSNLSICVCMSSVCSYWWVGLRSSLLTLLIRIAHVKPSLWMSSSITVFTPRTGILLHIIRKTRACQTFTPSSSDIQMLLIIQHLLFF
jgi:hypothetical protein